VKLLLDMNLSPTWVMVLQEAGFEALHWSKVGKPSAFYHEIFDWAVPDLI
jgi:predicted nuclease of predicted toxin-antitoxin system